MVPSGTGTGGGRIALRNGAPGGRVAGDGSRRPRATRGLLLRARVLQDGSRVSTHRAGRPGVSSTRHECPGLRGRLARPAAGGGRRGRGAGDGARPTQETSAATGMAGRVAAVDADGDPGRVRGRPGASTSATPRPGPTRERHRFVRWPRKVTAFASSADCRPDSSRREHRRKDPDRPCARHTVSANRRSCSPWREAIWRVAVSND